MLHRSSHMVRTQRGSNVHTLAKDSSLRQSSAYVPGMPPVGEHPGIATRR